MESDHPTFGNGKICYLEIPCENVDTSSSFYQHVFNWHVRKRSDGAVGFDDAVNEVSGSWVRDRKPSGDVGLLVHIMVDNAEETLKKIIAHGGSVVQEIGADFPEITARFADPFGNILGIYQHRSS